VIRHAVPIVVDGFDRTLEGITIAENRLPHLHSAFGGSEVCGCDCDLVAAGPCKTHDQVKEYNRDISPVTPSGCKNSDSVLLMVVISIGLQKSPLMCQIHMRYSTESDLRLEHLRDG
jgi:hypothetical protein